MIYFILFLSYNIIATLLLVHFITKLYDLIHETQIEVIGLNARVHLISRDLDKHGI